MTSWHDFFTDSNIKFGPNLDFSLGTSLVHCSEFRIVRNWSWNFDALLRFKYVRNQVLMSSMYASNIEFLVSRDWNISRNEQKFEKKCTLRFHEFFPRISRMQVIYIIKSYLHPKSCLGCRYDFMIWITCILEILG